MDRRKFMQSAGMVAAAMAGAGAAGLAGAVSAQAANVAGNVAGNVAQNVARLNDKNLANALRERKSLRVYQDKPLPEALLLELLWSACGVNRPDGRRTAPTALNRQEISVYVARAEGLCLYDAPNAALHRKLPDDLRAQTGTQSYVASAPVNLVYVADMNRAAGSTQEAKLLTVGLDTGFISQNVYLFCAVAGLATVARTGLDAQALARAMDLAAHQRVIMAQCVGYPKE